MSDKNKPRGIFHFIDSLDPSHKVDETLNKKLFEYKEGEAHILRPIYTTRSFGKTSKNRMQKICEAIDRIVARKP